MSRGNWGILAAALFGLALTTFSLGFFSRELASGHSQYQQAEGAGGSGNEKDRQPRQAETDHAGVPSLAERIISNPEPRNAEERQNRDLAAQENTAAWAFWIVLLSLFQAILSGIGILVIVKTLRHAQHVAYCELRAYVTFGIGKLIELKDDVWSVFIPTHNTGQTPATDVKSRSVAFLAEYPLRKGQIADAWKTTEVISMDAIGPHSEHGHTFRLPLTQAYREKISNGTLCIFARIQLSYTTYAGERIDEPPNDWIMRDQELVEKIASKTDESDYAEAASHDELPLAGGHDGRVPA
jgi:hypothetical protein